MQDKTKNLADVLSKLTKGVEGISVGIRYLTVVKDLLQKEETVIQEVKKLKSAVESLNNILADFELEKGVENVAKAKNIENASVIRQGIEEAFPRERTVKLKYENLTAEKKIIFSICEEDVQSVARNKLKRSLNEEELYKVKKGIQSAIMWEEIAEAAIDALGY